MPAVAAASVASAPIRDLWWGRNIVLSLPKREGRSVRLPHRQSARLPGEARAIRWRQISPARHNAHADLALYEIGLVALDLESQSILRFTLGEILVLARFGCDHVIFARSEACDL